MYYFVHLQSVNFLSWCNIRHLWFLGKIWKWNFKSFNLHLLIAGVLTFWVEFPNCWNPWSIWAQKAPAYASRISNYWGKQDHSQLLIFPILPHSERPSSSRLKYLCQFESGEGHSLKFHSLQWLGLMMGAGWVTELLMGQFLAQWEDTFLRKGPGQARKCLQSWHIPPEVLQSIYELSNCPKMLYVFFLLFLRKTCNKRRKDTTTMTLIIR